MSYFHISHVIEVIETTYLVMIFKMMQIISQVEIDLLNGETRFLQTDIIYDCGQSLNPAVDLGQVS